MSSEHTDGLRAGATVHARMAAAYRDGRATAAARGPLAFRPWQPNGVDPVERVLGKMWTRGYQAGLPAALDD